MSLLIHGSPPPVVTEILSVAPSIGVATDTVRITCTRLRSGATVTIGGASATITGSSYGTTGAYLDVTAPAHADGDVDVVVTDYHGIATLADGFTYEAGVATADFADNFETGDLNHTENDFAWKTPDGTDAIAGTGANGSFTRSSGSWTVNSYAGVPVYLQSVAGNANGDAGVMGPFTVISNTATVLTFVGDATGAVQKQTHRAFVTTALGRSGTKSARYLFGPNPDLLDSRSQTGINLPLPGVSELWLEYYLHIPANYTHREQSDGQENNKFFGLFERTRTADASRMLFDFELVPNGSGGSSIFAQSVFSNGVIASGAVHVFGDTGFEGEDVINAPGAPAVLDDWNQIRIHFKSESAALAADGVQELWINGTLVFQATGRRFGYPAAVGSTWAGTYPALLDNGYLLGAANTGYEERTVFHIDDVKFYLNDPGW